MEQRPGRSWRAGPARGDRRACRRKIVAVEDVFSHQKSRGSAIALGPGAVGWCWPSVGACGGLGGGVVCAGAGQERPCRGSGARRQVAGPRRMVQAMIGLRSLPAGGRDGCAGRWRSRMGPGGLRAGWRARGGARPVGAGPCISRGLEGDAGVRLTTTRVKSVGLRRAGGLRGDVLGVHEGSAAGERRGAWCWRVFTPGPRENRGSRCFRLHRSGHERARVFDLLIPRLKNVGPQHRDFANPLVGGPARANTIAQPDSPPRTSAGLVPDQRASVRKTAELLVVRAGTTSASCWFLTWNADGGVRAGPPAGGRCRGPGRGARPAAVNPMLAEVMGALVTMGLAARLGRSRRWSEFYRSTTIASLEVAALRQALRNMPR